MKARFFILISVSGCGKTTVGEVLAKHLGWDFNEADDFRLPENVAKMPGRTPLNDSDRTRGLLR